MYYSYRNLLTALPLTSRLTAHTMVLVKWLANRTLYLGEVHIGQYYPPIQ